MLLYNVRRHIFDDMDSSLFSVLNFCEKRMEVGGGCIWTVEFAWICYNCVLITISACLVLFLSPIAAGSGLFSAFKKYS